jgi:hypothetical protein
MKIFRSPHATVNRLQDTRLKKGLGEHKQGSNRTKTKCCLFLQKEQNPCRVLDNFKRNKILLHIHASQLLMGRVWCSNTMAVSGCTVYETFLYELFSPFFTYLLLPLLHATHTHTPLTVVNLHASAVPSGGQTVTVNNLHVVSQ